MGCFFKTSFMMLTPPGLLRVGDIVLLLAPGIPEEDSFDRDSNFHRMAGIPSLVSDSSCAHFMGFEHLVHT